MAVPLTFLVFYLAVINLEGVESVTPTPASGSDQEAACSTLQQVADRSSICTTTPTCTQLRCRALGTSTDITVLPCDTPPSVSVVTVQNGREIYSHVFSQSEVVPISPSPGIPPILNLNVSLAVSPNQDSMVLEVNAIPILGQPIPIIPRTTIPLSRSHCNTSSRPSDAPETAPTSAPPMQHPQTCQALQSISRGSAGQCNTVESCTALDCNVFNQYHAKLTVKPCNNPPAVGVVIEDTFGNVIVDETLVSSRTQPIQWNGLHLFDLVIHITHMQNPDAIILKVSVRSSTIGREVVLVPDTPIPIDRCGCPGVTCLSTNSPSSGGHGSHGIYTNSPSSDTSKQSLVVKIVVPLGLFVLLVVVTTVVALVIVGVVYSKKKRANAYNFQRVAFSNEEEEDEEEGLTDKI